MFIGKILNCVLHPKKLLNYIENKRLHSSYGKKLDDETYVRRMFKLEMGYDLNLENPRTFNEKLQWLKLYNRRPEYTTMVDKYEVKKYVADKIGEKYVVPLYGVWDKFEDIDFDSLPERFVLKTTHDCGGVVVCKDKSEFDKAEAKTFLEKHLAREYFFHGREWPYKNVKPRIIAEQYMVDESGYDLKDYKFFCFGGEVKLCMIERDRAKGRNGHAVDFFDRNFEHQNITVDGYPNAAQHYEKPSNYDELLAIAEKLAKNIPHIRVDLYNVNGRVYFGELTFFQASGNVKFSPIAWDEVLGNWIELHEKVY